jgi:hypothetical protein
VHDVIEFSPGVHTPFSAEEANPTDQTYGPLLAAYRHFNRELFENRLPSCLITLQRKAGSKGYFSADKFASLAGDVHTDEIALNPAHFRVHTPRETCSTLVHEMVHLAQRHFGKPARAGYHDKKWARAMVAIGLQPSSTGAPGGKETGYRVSHFILPNGRYDVSYAAFELAGHTIGWGDAFTRGNDGDQKKPKRIKFVCPHCRANVMGKASTDVRCNPCDLVMEPE